VRARFSRPMEERMERELAALREEYEVKIAQLKERYPAAITRKIAEALVGERGTEALASLFGGAGVAVAPAPVAVPRPAPVAAPAPVPEPVEEVEPEAVEEAEAAEETMALEPYIDTELCTSCNECTQLNPKIFAYNENKQAYIKDPKGGPYADIVKAAERCTAKVIHPGDPLDPKEPDLEKWVKRAQPFN